MRRLLFGAAAIGMVAPGALGAMIITSSYREVYALRGTTTDQGSTTDAGVYSDTRTATTSVTASQESEILPTSVTFLGWADVTGPATNTKARSYLEVQFTLTEPAPFTLTGSGSGTKSGYGFVNLRTPSGDWVAGGGATNAFEPIIQSGVLPAGDYVLSTKCEATPFSAGSNDHGSLNFAFVVNTVPEPASGLLVLMAAGLLRRRSN